MGVVERGLAADRLLGDETVREVFALVKADYQRCWEEAHRPDVRELYWQRVHALDDVLLMFKKIRDAGLVEQRKQQKP